MLGINRLRMIREVAARGSITAAADSLGLTPSAVSQQLRLLEAEAGVPLLERGPRQVTLTEAGRRLVFRSTEILTALTAAEAEMRRMAALEDGTVRLAAFPSAAAVTLPPVLAALRGRAPRLTVQFEELEPDDALQALREGAVDVAVVYDFADRPLHPPPDVQLMHAHDDPFLLCLSADHPLADETQLSLEEACALPWLADGDPPAESCFALRYLADHGLRPTVAARANDPVVLKALLISGAGVAMLPEMQIRAAYDGFATVLLQPAPQPRRVLVASRTGSQETPAIRTAVDVVTHILKHVPPE